MGPYSATEVLELARNGEIVDGALIWSPRLGAWQAAAGLLSSRGQEQAQDGTRLSPDGSYAPNEFFPGLWTADPVEQTSDEHGIVSVVAELDLRRDGTYTLVWGLRDPKDSTREFLRSEETGDYALQFGEASGIVEMHFKGSAVLTDVMDPSKSPVVNETAGFMSFVARDDDIIEGMGMTWRRHR